MVGSTNLPTTNQPINSHPQNKLSYHLLLHLSKLNPTRSSTPMDRCSHCLVRMPFPPPTQVELGPTSAIPHNSHSCEDACASPSSLVPLASSFYQDPTLLDLLVSAASQLIGPPPSRPRCQLQLAASKIPLSRPGSETKPS